MKKRRESIPSIRESIQYLSKRIMSLEGSINELKEVISFTDMKEFGARLKSCEVATNQSRNVLEAMETLLRFNNRLGLPAEPQKVINKNEFPGILM